MVWLDGYEAPQIRQKDSGEQKLVQCVAGADGDARPDVAQVQLDTAGQQFVQGPLKHGIVVVALTDGKQQPVIAAVVVAAARHSEAVINKHSTSVNSIASINGGFVVQLVVQQQIESQQQVHSKSPQQVVEQTASLTTSWTTCRTASPQQVHSKLHATISKSYSKAHNLLYDRSTANRTNGVRHQTTMSGAQLGARTGQTDRRTDGLTETPVMLGSVD